MKSLNNITPYKILFVHTPSYSHLISFGCLCYVSYSPVHRSKFDPRVGPCVFVVYPATQKGYKVLNLTTFKIYVSRNVIFHERHYPLHISNSSSSVHPPFFLPSHTEPSPYIHTDLPYIFQPPSPTPTPSASPSTSLDLLLFPLITTPVPLPSTLRRTTRPITRPSYLNDYSFHTSIQHWYNLVQYNLNIYLLVINNLFILLPNLLNLFPINKPL